MNDSEDASYDTENPHDPVDEIEQRTLKELIEPYQRYGDDQLAMALLQFQQKYGGPGISRPAVREADYHCPNCEENVRGVSRPDGHAVACPLCGEPPGALTLGEGPK